MECWCPNCTNGLMEGILDKSFEQKISVKEWIGKEVECPECRTKHLIDDIVELMPTVFNIVSVKNVEKYRKEESLKNHLEKQ